MNIQGIGQVFTAYQPQTVSSDTQASGFDVQRIISEEDSNGDGFLTIDETALSEDMFANADTDADDQLSSDELEDMLAQAPPPPPMTGDMPSGGQDGMDMDALFAEEDTDGDGTISQEESALSEDMFSDFDADGDGLLTAEEIEAMAPPAQPPEGGTMMPGKEGDSLYDTLISALESSEQTGRENEQNLLQTMAMNAYQNTLVQAMNPENEYDTTGQSDLLQIFA